MKGFTTEGAESAEWGDGVWGVSTLTLALSHDGRGDKRPFDRLRANGACLSEFAEICGMVWHFVAFPTLS